MWDGVKSRVQEFIGATEIGGAERDFLEDGGWIREKDELEGELDWLMDFSAPRAFVRPAPATRAILPPTMRKRE